MPDAIGDDALQHQSIQIGAESRRALTHQAGADPAGHGSIPRAIDVARGSQRRDAPVTRGCRGRMIGQLLPHAIRKSSKCRNARLAGQRTSMPFGGATPPIQHRISELAIGGGSPFDAALEDFGCCAKVVFEKERLANRNEELHLIADIEARCANRAKRVARGAEVCGIGAFPVKFEMGAREHDCGSVRSVWEALGGRCRLDRLVELALVVMGASLGEMVGP